MVHLSWEEVAELAQQLAEKIRASGNQFNCIVGIARGGLPAMGMFARYLEIDEVHSIRARSYDDKTNQQSEFEILFVPQVDLSNKSVILFDEIVDTGLTIDRIKSELGNRCNANDAVTASLYVNSAHCKKYPDYFVTETKEWVRFPWDN